MMDNATYQWMAMGGVAVVGLAVSAYQDYQMNKITRRYTEKMQKHIQEANRIINNIKTLEVRTA